MENNLTRRDFVMLTTMAGTGLSFGLTALQPTEAFAQGANAPDKISAYLTPIAVADDCVRLAMYSATIAEAFKQSLTKHLDVVRLGGAMRSGHKHVPTLFSQCRDRWATRGKGDVTPQKLALATGWLFHKAADTQFSAASRVSATKSHDEDRIDSTIYQDIAVLREIYLSEKGPSASTASNGMSVHPSIQAVSVKDLNDLFDAMGRRLLIQLHTFEPDAEDVDGWLPRLFAWRERQDALFRRYAEAYRSPDPGKVRRYITGANFYDRTDPIIRLARSLQHGAANNKADLDRAIAAANSQSQYAQALRTGYRHLQAASEFFERSIDEQQLKNRLGLMNAQESSL